MSNKGRVTTGVVTLVIAIGAGHLMQGGWSDSRSAPAARAPEHSSASSWTPLPTQKDSAMLLRPANRRPVPTIDSLELSFPVPPSAALAALELPPTPRVSLSAPADISVASATAAAEELDGFGMACTTEVEAAAAPGAMIRLDVAATCLPEAVVEVRHAGVWFRSLTDTAGRLSLDLPALAADARLTVQVGDAAPVSRSLQVADAASYERVSVAWSGAAKLSVHALEFGAAPGGKGHASARTQDSGTAAGVVRRFGAAEVAEPALAEVYSFPTAGTAREGTVRISVAAEITEASCDRDLDLTLVRSRAGAGPSVETARLPAPGCQAVGDILVLKNLVQDLKIAATQVSD